MCLEKTKTSLWENFGHGALRLINRTAMLRWFSDSGQTNLFILVDEVFMSRRANILEFSRNIFFIDPAPVLAGFPHV